MTLEPLLRGLRLRLANLLLKGLMLRADRTAAGLQRLTVSGPGRQPRAGLRHWLPYGLDFIPLPPDGDRGPEALILTLAPGHRVVLPMPDARHAGISKAAAPGDLAVYAAGGAQLVLRRSGAVEAYPAAGQPLRVFGDLEITGALRAAGEISSAADVVTQGVSLGGHTHGGVEAGGDNSGGPNGGGGA